MRMLHLLLLSSWCALAAAPPPAGPASLSYFNREVVTLRAPLMGMAPAERVVAAEARLRVALAESTAVDVTVVPTDLGRAIQLNGHLLFFLQHGDLDPEGGLTLDEAAKGVADGLRVTLTQSLDQRRSDSLTRSLAAVGIATFLFALMVAALAWLRTKLLALLERSVGARAAVLRFGTLSVVRWRTVGLVLSTSVRTLTTVLMLVLSVQWLAFGLSQFPYTRPWGDSLQGFILSVLSDGLLSGVKVLPDLAVVVAIAWLTWMGMRLSGALFHQVETGRWTTSWLTPETAGVTRKLVSFGLVMFALVMAYPYFPGSDTEAFKGLSVLLGVMVSLGGSSTVGQAAAGLILIYTHAFSVGDQVRIGDATGRVTAIGMFTTRLVTHLGEELVIPNAAILGATTRNYTREGQTMLLEVVVTIGYDVSWRQVEALLREAAARTASVLTEPAPRVVVGSLDDFFITYRLVASASDAAPRETVLAELQRNVLDAFNDAKVQIMSPHYNGDPVAAKLSEGRPLASRVALE